jgi:hypothetical protein
MILQLKCMHSVLDENHFADFPHQSLHEYPSVFRHFFLNEKHFVDFPFQSLQECPTIFRHSFRNIIGLFVSPVRNQFWIPCYNDAAEVGYSGCDDEVLPELGDESVAPSCTGLAEVHMRYGLGLGALWTDFSRSAEAAFPNVDW